MSKQILIAVLAMVSAQDGYRRAGIDLLNGKNELELTEAQLAQFEADSRIVVTRVDAKSQSATNGAGGGKKEPEKATFNAEAPAELDLSSFEPEALAPYVAAVHQLHKDGKLELNAQGKPNVDDLSVEVDGKTIKPSAADRDAAWDGYKKLIGA
ncbi:HI1506-related protein [Pseudidiomarina aestuarii]|uniref:HI1506-related protein n=1 Tax=Pseudidiomarina aestuarii TaxID=624146 RepID=UPI003A96B264